MQQLQIKIIILVSTSFLFITECKYFKWPELARNSLAYFTCQYGSVEKNMLHSNDLDLLINIFQLLFLSF